MKTPLLRLRHLRTCYYSCCWYCLYHVYIGVVLFYPLCLLWISFYSGHSEHHNKPCVWVENTGSVTLYESISIETVCRLDLRYFPYDKQTCTFSFGSWTYWTDVIKLVPSVNLETTHYYNQRLNDFRITNFNANAHEWEEYQGGWASADYSVNLERISSAYSVKLVLPAVVTGFMILLTFLLPPASQEKIILAGLIILCHVLQLLYLQDLVPASGHTMLGDFLSFVLCMDFLCYCARYGVLPRAQ